jgi:hypothetical protein
MYEYCFTIHIYCINFSLQQILVSGKVNCILYYNSVLVGFFKVVSVHVYAMLPAQFCELNFT